MSIADYPSYKKVIEGQTPLVLSKKEANRVDILKLLKDGPTRFNELQKLSGFTPRGFSKMLKDLIDAGHVEKTIHQNKPAYKITKKGSEKFKILDHIYRHRRERLEEGGQYLEDFSNQYFSVLSTNYPWGIQDDLILDKNMIDVNPITKDIAIELNETLYKKILSNVKKKKTKLDDNASGNIIFELSIDYREFVKSIKEDSLKGYHNVTEEELDICDKINNGVAYTEERDLLKQFRESKITHNQFKRKWKAFLKTVDEKGKKKEENKKK